MFGYRLNLTFQLPTLTGSTNKKLPEWFAFALGDLQQKNPHVTVNRFQPGGGDPDCMDPSSFALFSTETFLAAVMRWVTVQFNTADSDYKDQILEELVKLWKTQRAEKEYLQSGAKFFSVENSRLICLPVTKPGTGISVRCKPSQSQLVKSITSARLDRAERLRLQALCRRKESRPHLPVLVQRMSCKALTTTSSLSS